ncbi:MAG: hypothetical protein ACOVKO_04270 [Elstera sp.]
MTEFSFSSGADTHSDHPDYTIEARIDGEWVAQQEARSLETALLQVRKLVPTMGAKNVRIVSDAENGKRRLYSVQYQPPALAPRLGPSATLGKRISNLRGAPMGPAVAKMVMLVALGAACGTVGVIVFQLLHLIDGLVVGQ